MSVQSSQARVISLAKQAQIDSTPSAELQLWRQIADDARKLHEAASVAKTTLVPHLSNICNIISGRLTPSATGIIGNLAKQPVTAEEPRRRSPTSMNEPILCKIPEAAHWIRRCERFIYELIATGQIEAVKSGRSTLVVVASLHKYANDLPPAKIKPITRRGGSPDDRRRGANSMR